MDNDIQTLNGLFKEVYADKMERLIPEALKVLNTIKFVSRERSPGNLYHQPVVLGMEHGVTFADDTEGAFTLLPPVAGQIKDSTVRGYQLLLRSVMSYSAAARSVGAGNRAFEDATKFLVGNMISSINKKLELEALYGQMGYAKIASAAAPVGADVALTIKASEFASGIWSGAEKMPLEIYNAASPVDTAVVVKSVNLETRLVTVTCATSGAATALKAAVDANLNILDIFHKGAKGKEFAGIHKILTNTGTLFGIDSNEYTLWKGSEFDAADEVLSFAILQQAISQGVAKGLEGDVTVMVNPGHWDDLLTEQTSLRMYDSSYSSAAAENGAKTIKFHSQNGMVEIVPSIYIKEGYAFVLSISDWMRIGSTDVTFKRPGQGENFFRDLTDQAGYELRCYTDQAVFCSKPGRSVLIKGLKIA